MNLLRNCIPFFSRIIAKLRFSAAAITHQSLIFHWLTKKKIILIVNCLHASFFYFASGLKPFTHMYKDCLGPLYKFTINKTLFS